MVVAVAGALPSTGRRKSSWAARAPLSITIGKWLIEDSVKSAALGANAATRARITEDQTGRRVTGAGSNEDVALEVACGKMDISTADLDDEIEEDK
jgi:hypothetical protein